jgi:inosine/xanthosine triphosphate pyrophosphatase family protein
MGMRIVAGTGNKAKVRELAAALGDGVAVEAVPSDISLEHLVERGAESNNQDIVGIASAKALAWSRALTAAGQGGAVVVATDGGLLVPALGAAWDPARTRRFAGEGADDRERADALLVLAADLVGEERTIGWREAAGVARAGLLLATFVAESPPGLLAADYDPDLLAAGDGFWVPALWTCPEVGGKRLAELTEAERAGRVDHWTVLGRALRRFLIEDRSLTGG